MIILVIKCLHYFDSFSYVLFLVIALCLSLSPESYTTFKKTIIINNKIGNYATVLFTNLMHLLNKLYIFHRG